MTLPEIPTINQYTGLVEHYAVYHTLLEQFVPIESYGDATLWLTTNRAQAKAQAAKFNKAVKPEYQHYTIVTVTFNPEV